MRKSYLYIAIASVLLAAASTSVYAQQISGKGAGAVLNISAFDRIVNRADDDLENFLACSSKGLFLATATGDSCVLARPPERVWSASNTVAPDISEFGGAPSDKLVYIRFENPMEPGGAEKQIPIPDRWVANPSASLYGPAGIGGKYFYYNGSGQLLKTCEHANPNCQ